MLVEISKLKINPIHSQLYQTMDIESLAESIQELGILEKIVVTPDLTIISGVRRFLALKELGYTQVDVIIKEVKEEDITLTLISYNKQRVKTCRELLNEIKFLKEIWGQKRGRKTQAQKLADGVNSQPVDTRKRISEVTKVSTGNISKLEYIDRERTDLIEEIDKGKTSIEQVHKALKKNEEIKKIRDISSSKSALPTTISNKDYTIYNESSDDLSKLKDGEIQTIMTSPPYFAVRSYTEMDNELGSEKTRDEFVQKMANHLHACYRVLNEKGSFFINFGDKFLNKDLQLIPHRVIIELQKKGWILRNTIIWHKLNRLPGTTKDNLTASYEFIFHLVKSKDYTYNTILIPNKTTPKKGVNIIKLKDAKFNESNFGHVTINGLSEGKKLEDFWTQDLIETAGVSQKELQRYGIADHPAPFPIDICFPPILLTSNPGDTVLDIFSGSGTTGEAALLLGRKYVGYELNANFNSAQKKRLDEAIKKYNEASQLPVTVKQAA